MNEDQVKGKAKDVAGKIQRKAGDVTDNESLQVKGAKNQAKGKAQETYGDAKDAAKDATKDND